MGSLALGPALPPVPLVLAALLVGAAGARVALAPSRSDAGGALAAAVETWIILGRGGQHAPQNSADVRAVSGSGGARPEDASRLSWLSEMVGEESEQLRRTFNSVAERYDAIRPTYPRQAIEDLTAVVGLGEHSSILEIGCGTGQLTVPLAALGVTVTAIELGDALAGVARRNLARFPAARVLTGAFEDMPVPDQGYDLVVAATAFHWLDRATRVDRCARMLRPGGWLAVIDTEHVAAGTVDFFHAAQTCYETWDPATPPGLRLKPVDEIPAARPELDDAPAFGPVELRRYTWEATYTTAQYRELLLTYSGHLALADDRREGLLACISDLADRKFGGRVTKGYLTELRLTRHI